MYFIVRRLRRYVRVCEADQMSHGQYVRIGSSDYYIVLDSDDVLLLESFCI